MVFVMTSEVGEGMRMDEVHLLFSSRCELARKGRVSRFFASLPLKREEGVFLFHAITSFPRFLNERYTYEG